MHFTSSVAILALAASTVAGARLQPYKPARRMALMPLPGLSLARRDSAGYTPEETKCNNPDATTCAGACGEGYDQCDATDKAIHCFNPAAGQTCCPNSNGNSCEAGYYCAADSENETFCCPQGMDITACAAAYTVTGGLEIPVETTSSTSTSSTSTPEPEPETTTYTPEPTTSEYVTPTPVTVSSDVTTSICPSSTPVYTGYNSTIITPPASEETSATLIPLPTISDEQPPVVTTVPEQPTTVPDSGASALAGSGLLLVAAGFIALL